jgi:hypothetical protein
VSFLLRKISKAKWLIDPELGNELQADALNDLRTGNNRLSVWFIETDHANLNQVITALASNRERVEKVDYVLIDMTTLNQHSFTLRNIVGDTPYEAANSFHRDLENLRARQILDLALMIQVSTKNRVAEKEVRQLLTRALNDGLLDESLIKQTLLAELMSRS